MKKLFCMLLAALMALSMAACAESGDTPSATEPSEKPGRPDLEQFGPWVVTAEYETSANKSREYRYDENGNLLGYGDYRVKTEGNDLGGKTVRLMAYDEKGNLSNRLSRHEYVYNGEGKLVSYQRNEALGDKLADSFTFEYDTYGNMVRQEKYYMGIWQEEITYAYDDGRLVKSTFKSSVYESTYTFVYDDSAVPSKLDYNTKYVKTGNVDKGTLELQKVIYENDTTYRVTLSVAEGSHSAVGGKDLVVYEERYDTEGQIQSVTLEFGDWGIFHNGVMPMRQYGALTAGNWSNGSAKYVYQPLSVYLEK